MKIDTSSYDIFPCTCGSTPHMEKEVACDGMWYRLRCPSCGRTSGIRSYDTGYQAVSAWNSAMRELGMEVR